MKSPSYRPELDALRFFAFACVFMFHTRVNFRLFEPLHDAGGYGLCMFFLLSSFLITGTLLRERSGYGSINVGAFFTRRVLRIWPLYFTAIGLTLVAGAFYPPAQLKRGALLALIFLLTNFYVQHYGWLSMFIDPLWSISLEEQFYVLTPWMWKFATRTTLLLVYWAVLLISWATIFFLSFHSHQPFWTQWLNSFVQFQFFAAGGLLAMFYEQRVVLRSQCARGALLVLGAAGWAVAPHWPGLLGFAHQDTRIVPLMFASVFVGTIALFLAALDTSFTFPPFAIYLGKISYGLYVFHQAFLSLFMGYGSGPLLPVFRGYGLLGFFAAIPCTLGCAALSYKFLEKPFLRLKRSYEVVPTRTT